MASRYATGLTVASFPLTAALLAITVANYRLAAFLGILFLVVVLLTGAPRIRYLCRLPVFGAVRMAVDFRANGAAGVEVEGGEKVVLAVPRGSLPSTVLIEMAARNLSNREVENVLFARGCSVGNGMVVCDGWGRPVTEGDPIPPGEGFDRWAMTGRHLIAKKAPLFHLRMRVREVGRYRAYIGMSSAFFRGGLGAFCEIEVVESDTPSLRDQLAPIIDRAEVIAKEESDVFGGEDAMRHALMGVISEASDLLLQADSHELINRFKNAEPDYPSVRVGDEYLRASAMAKVKVLYELRTELGRQERPQ